MLPDELMRQFKELQREVNRIKLFDIPKKSDLGGGGGGGGGGGETGIWQDYTPVWSTPAGVATLGNGTLTGRYYRIGNLIIVHVFFSWWFTTSITGGGQWLFTTPAAGRNYDIGIAELYGSGADYSFSASHVGPGSAFVSPASCAGDSAPFAWVPSSHLQIKIVYEAQ